MKIVCPITGIVIISQDETDSIFITKHPLSNYNIVRQRVLDSQLDSFNEEYLSGCILSILYQYDLIRKNISYSPAVFNSSLSSKLSRRNLILLINRLINGHNSLKSFTGQFNLDSIQPMGMEEKKLCKYNVESFLSWLEVVCPLTMEELMARGQWEKKEIEKNSIDCPETLSLSFSISSSSSSSDQSYTYYQSEELVEARLNQWQDRLPATLRLQPETKRHNAALRSIKLLKDTDIIDQRQYKMLLADWKGKSLRENRLAKLKWKIKESFNSIPRAKLDQACKAIMLLDSLRIMVRDSLVLVEDF